MEGSDTTHLLRGYDRDSAGEGGRRWSPSRWQRTRRGEAGDEAELEAS